MLTREIVSLTVSSGSFTFQYGRTTEQMTNTFPINNKIDEQISNPDISKEFELFVIYNAENL